MAVYNCTDIRLKKCVQERCAMQRLSRTTQFKVHFAMSDVVQRNMYPTRRRVLSVARSVQPRLRRDTLGRTNGRSGSAYGKYITLVGRMLAARRRRRAAPAIF